MNLIAFSTTRKFFWRRSIAIKDATSLRATARVARLAFPSLWPGHKVEPAQGSSVVPSWPPQREVSRPLLVRLNRRAVVVSCQGAQLLPSPVLLRLGGINVLFPFQPESEPIHCAALRNQPIPWLFHDVRPGRKVE